MITFFILLGITILIAEIAAAFQFSQIAEIKGFPETKYFWWCLLFPPLGIPMVIALPDITPPSTQSSSNVSKKQTAAPQVKDELPDL